MGICCFAIVIIFKHLSDNLLFVRNTCSLFGFLFDLLFYIRCKLLFY
jgi:hypothetical protein